MRKPINISKIYRHFAQSNTVSDHPDRHIAWRCVTAPSDRKAKLMEVFHQLGLIVPLL